MGRIRGIWHWTGRHPVISMVVVAVLAAIVGFAGGEIAGDESGDVSRLQTELSSSRSELGEVKDAKAGLAELKVAQALEVEELEEELAAERSFEGEGEKQQAAEQEYETDFPWGAAGRAGDFIFKPTAWKRDGEKWLLTVEAKNVSREPLSPFCGGAESIVIDAGQNNYTGDSVLGDSDANCSGELQPGTTATYEAEFKLPPNAAPVVIAIYGEYDQEEEAKTWELPH